MTHFYIIRHGETVFNRKGRIQGWCDSPLTDLGVSQAKQLGKELKNILFDVCFCSTSERAIDTANYILGGRNVKIIPSKKLKEQSYGDFEAEKSVNIFKDGVSFPDGYRFCGGENHSDVIERVMNELKKIASEYPNANVLVVCHGSAIKHIVNYLSPGFVMEKPTTAALVPNCSITQIDYDDDFKLIEKPHPFHGQ
ncbi:histidine phosphatase family protein [uncultured Holdemanella sp.]|uniref:histidine phosphatase family protein n=1 Tax=uncultured Holdemanella sp. TaxID=1763549 RepID=UPI00265A6CD0|nr:histidine phosphatase family protein [uncultured Holdemanella sp.]